jgi:SET domain-containing protein
MSKEQTLPHHGVYVRIGRSKIHGVGLIAIVPIKKGTDLFPNDQSELTWIKADSLPEMYPSHRKLYNDFCIRKGDSYGCPPNLNDLTVSWYLNHSDKPNVVCDSEYRFFALRDIREGEELTVDYRTYTDSAIPGGPAASKANNSDIDT